MSGVDHVRGNHNPLYNPRCETNNARCARSSVAVNGNTIETPGYELTASNHELMVRKKGTNEWFKVWGDPHITTSDGDNTNFQKGNVTVKLDDGTKITFDPTKIKNGVSYLDQAVITNGNDAAVVNYDGHGNPTTSARPGQGRWLDLATPDGLKLRTTHGSPADLALVGGPEIKGDKIKDLDHFRNGGRFSGDSRPSLPTRPHVGLPDWRHDGRFGGWPRHASGPCWPDGGRHDLVSNLRSQLRYFEWQEANARSWSAQQRWDHKGDLIRARLDRLT